MEPKSGDTETEPGDTEPELGDTELYPVYKSLNLEIKNLYLAKQNLIQEIRA